MFTEPPGEPKTKPEHEADEPDTKLGNRAAGEGSWFRIHVPGGPLPPGQITSRHTRRSCPGLSPRRLEDRRGVCLFIQEMVIYLQIIIIERHFCSLISTQK